MAKGKPNGKSWWPHAAPKAQGEETVIVALSRNQWDTTIAALSIMLNTVREDYSDQPRRRDRLVMELKIIMGVIGNERERG